MKANNNIEVTYQEAYISALRLTVEFKLNSVELVATGLYYNGSQIEDTEVYRADDSGDNFDDSSDEYQSGKHLLEQMDLDRHLTF